MSLRIEPDETGQLVLTVDLPGLPAGKFFVADTDRSRPLEENSQASVAVLAFIGLQLERIADAAEALVSAPPSKTRSKTDA